MKKGDKIQCKKTLQQFNKNDNVVSKFERLFIKIMGWNKKFYIKNKWYEIVDSYTHPVTKELLSLSIKTEKNDIVDYQIFTLNNFGVGMLRLEEYFYYGLKDTRRAKLNSLKKKW